MPKFNDTTIYGDLTVNGTITGNATSATNADKLDNQHGSYYLDWTNITNKPDPKITLGGDLSGSVTLTDLGNGTLNATIAANSVALGTDTTGNYVATVSGITNGGLSISGSGGENAAVTIGHSRILTAAGSQSGSEGNIAYGGTILIPSISYDINGHITSTTTTSVKLPAAQTIPTGFNISAGATGGIFNITGTGGTNSVSYAVAPYAAPTAGGFYSAAVDPNGTTRLNWNGYLYGTKLYSGGNEVAAISYYIEETGALVLA